MEFRPFYSDSHKEFSETGVKLDSIRSGARKSVDLRHANDPRSCERCYGHSRDSEVDFEHRYRPKVSSHLDQNSQIFPDSL